MTKQPERRSTYIAPQGLKKRFYGALTAQNKTLLKAGDVVLLKTEQPRSQWPLAKIISLHPDREGILRVVKVLCKGQTSLRTIDKLVPLELASIPEGEGSEDQGKPASSNSRPTRAAALSSQKQWRGLISEGHIT